MHKPPKIAIIGSGISGLAVAHTLGGRVAVTLFEAGAYFGGHTHTVDITLPTPHGAVSHGIDTGFLVFNERTYPNLIKLLADLKVETAKSDMSFSVKAAGARAHQALEWSGSSLNTVFAQRRNLVSWRFLRMLRDVLRFNKMATLLAESGRDAELMQPLGSAPSATTPTGPCCIPTPRCCRTTNWPGPRGTMSRARARAPATTLARTG